MVQNLQTILRRPLRQPDRPAGAGGDQGSHRIADGRANCQEWGTNQTKDPRRPRGPENWRHLTVEDIVIRNINLSPDDLERRLKPKWSLNSRRPRPAFRRCKCRSEANTAIIKAKGEAEPSCVRGEALKLNPAFLAGKLWIAGTANRPVVVPSRCEQPGGRFAVPIGSPEKAAAP